MSHRCCPHWREWSHKEAGTVGVEITRETLEFVCHIGAPTTLGVDYTTSSHRPRYQTQACLWLFCLQSLHARDCYGYRATVGSWQHVGWGLRCCLSLSFCRPLPNFTVWPQAACLSPLCLDVLSCTGGCEDKFVKGQVLTMPGGPQILETIIVVILCLCLCLPTNPL